CIGHGRAAPADLVRDFFLPHPKFTCQTSVTLRLFDRIQIRALQIFDERKFEYIAIARAANNHWHFIQPRFLCRPPAPFTSNQFVAPIDRPHNQRLNDSMLPDRFDQLRERVGAEILARLQWAWGNAVETDALNFFRIIDRRNCWSWRGLRGNECAETFAER